MNDTEDTVEYEWGAPSEDLCPHCADGVLRDHALEVEDALGGHGWTWRECGRCGRIVAPEETD